MFEWPEKLPRPSSVYTVDSSSSNIRSRMDSGRARQRPRFTEMLDTASVVFQFTKVELALFQSIWVHNLNMGNDWFLIDLPVANGQSLTKSEVRFIEDFTKDHQAFENWTVSSTIEFREVETVGEDLAWLIIEYGDNYEEEFAADVAILEDEVEHFPIAHPWII